MNTDTAAYIDSAATANNSEVGASPKQSVLVCASRPPLSWTPRASTATARERTTSAVLDAATINRTINAYIGPLAEVNALDDVVLDAASSLAASSIVAGTAGAGNLTIDGSVALLSFATTTQAYIDRAAAVTAQNNVSLAADHTTTINAQSGASTFGGTVGVGFSNATIYNLDVTNAYINTAQVLANGDGAAIAVPTGQRDSSGNELTSPVNGVSLTATSYEDVTPVSAGLAGPVLPHGRRGRIGNLHGAR